jgi:hypothetical protein
MTMTVDLDHPGQRALLALQLAGFDAARLPADLLQSPLQDGFELAFGRGDGGAVTLAYDASDGHFEIEETLGAPLPHERLALALMLNASLPRQQRIGLHPQTRCLQVSSCLDHEQADVATLAAELGAVAQIAENLQTATALADAPEPGPPMDWTLRA